jgi:hypothetical protein
MMTVAFMMYHTAVSVELDRDELEPSSKGHLAAAKDVSPCRHLVLIHFACTVLLLLSGLLFRATSRMPNDRCSPYQCSFFLPFFKLPVDQSQVSCSIFFDLISTKSTKDLFNPEILT